MRKDTCLKVLGGTMHTVNYSVIVTCEIHKTKTEAGMSSTLHLVCHVSDSQKQLLTNGLNMDIVKDTTVDSAFV